MKNLIIKTVALCLITAGACGTAFAQDGVFDFAGDAIGALTNTPFDTAVDGVNDGLRTIQGVTTVTGNVRTTVEAGDITQSIEGGEENVNELNLGAVSGGSYIDGSFTSNVTVGDITQSITGNKNRNRANIGSVTN